jgi:hypothetical protein
MASLTVCKFGIFTKKRQNIKFVAKYFKNNSRPQNEQGLDGLNFLVILTQLSIWKYEDDVEFEFGSFET